MLPHISVDPDIWVDASTDWGMGVGLGQKWAAWKLKPIWKSDGWDIGWGELIALELAILLLMQVGHIDCDIVIHGDNTGLIGAFSKGCSHNVLQNDSICHMVASIIPNNISISPVYIPSASNKADCYE